LLPTASPTADKTAEVDSSDFSLDDASISSNATSYKSQSDLDADTALIYNPKISTCYQQLIKTQAATSLPAGSTITAITLTITPRPGGGPSNVVGTGTGSITVTSGGATIPIYVSVAFITGPLIEAEVDFENPTQPVQAAMFTNLVGGGRYATDIAGYRAMLAFAKRFPDRTWAVEGCQGIGRHFANRLLDGELVIDVPPKLSARTRMFATGQGRKTDATDAHSVALVGTRMSGLRQSSTTNS
jgi:hypothetical protein